MRGSLVLAALFLTALTFSAWGDEAAIADIKNMAPGWNLGNTLEGVPHEGAWGNPPVKPETFDDIWASGFRSVRIPVNFYDHMAEGPNYVIDPLFLDRVSEVVDMALARGFYAIVDNHHHWKFFDKLKDPKEAPRQIERFVKVWKQVAERLKDKGRKVLFETTNEPDGTVEQVNEINAKVIDVIRKSGGGNDKRLIVVPDRWTSTEQVDTMILPANDPNLVVTCHWYNPWWFISGTQTTWGSAEERQNLDAQLKHLGERFVSKGIPVILGEWAVSGNLRYQDWVYADAFNNVALKYGITTMVWDNGASFDRAAHQWREPGLPQVIVAASKGAHSSFLKNPEVWLRAGNKLPDTSIAMDLNGNTVVGVSRDGTALIAGKDFEVNGAQLTLKAAYLNSLDDGKTLGPVARLTVKFSAGAALSVVVHRFDTPEFSPQALVLGKSGHPRADQVFTVRIQGNGKPVQVRAMVGSTALKDNGNLNFGEVQTDSWQDPDAVTKFTVSGQWVIDKFSRDGSLTFEFGSGEKVSIPVKIQ